MVTEGRRLSTAEFSGRWKTSRPAYRAHAHRWKISVTSRLAETSVWPSVLLGRVVLWWSRNGWPLSLLLRLMDTAAPVVSASSATDWAS